MRTPRLALLTLAGVSVVAACDPPTHPNRYANTILQNICHTAYDCCTPTERQLVLGVFFTASQSKETCLEELNDFVGGFLQVAQQAVEDGTATYDAEAATRCTAEVQAAVDRCDAQAIADLTGSYNFNVTAFGVDADDPECLALAQRAFTRGTRANGEDCTSDIDCADFGICVIEGDRNFTRAGTCRNPGTEGNACADDVGCGPGLTCVDDTCIVVERAENGETCTDDGECASGNCEGSERSCEGSGDPCDFDDECTGSCIDDVCVGSGDACFSDFDCEGVCVGTEGTCADVSLRVEVCDGL
jgi:hypothetical protein